MKHLRKLIYFFVPILILNFISVNAQVTKSFKNGVSFYSNSNTENNSVTTSNIIEQLNPKGVTLSSKWQIDSIDVYTQEGIAIKSVFTYENSKVMKHLALDYENSNWVNYVLGLNEYDENNNRILYLSKRWYNNEWQDYSKITFEYNDENNEIYSLSEFYHDSVWVNRSRSYKDYQDPNYKETLHQFFEDDLWQNDIFIQDYYGPGEIPEYSVVQIWNDNNWKNYIQFDRDFNELNQLTYIAIELWQNGSFEFVAKVEYLYNGNDQIEKQNYYEKVDNNWELIYRQSYYYDENHNAVEIINEDSVDGQWQPINAPIVVSFPYGYAIGYLFYKVQLYYGNVSDIEENSEIVNDFTLSQNYPNPFNPNTTIKFTTPPSPYQGEGLRVRLKVYDILGREIKTLLNKPMQPGSYEVEFNGNNLTSGVYFYVLESGGMRLSKKMLLLK